MATYKVIQDIEAEDKLVGPFSLRQFIYLAIALIAGFIAYQIAQASWVIALPFLLPVLFFGALAAPLGDYQSSEIWLLAKIRFYLKPQKRIWSQDGMKQLVTITVPKKLDKHYTDGLSQTEVRSRLSALANTLDSRGWAVKNVSQPSEAVDVLDENASQTAQNMNSLLQQSTQQHKQALMEKMRNPQAQATTNTPNDYWFMHQQEQKAKDGFDSFNKDSVVAPGAKQESTTQVSEEEKAIVEKLKQSKGKDNNYHHHMKTIKPISQQEEEAQQAAAMAASAPKPKPVPKAEPKPDIMRLANNNDLNISTISRQANKGLSEGDEVEISLH